MKTLPGMALLVAVALAGSGCRPASRESVMLRASSTLQARQARLTQNLAKAADSATDRSAPAARWILPKDFSEISGIALTPDGRLLAHDDELGRVFEVDYRRGVVVKEFSLGREMLHEDFEGITVGGGRVYMLSSNGKVYDFPEGKNGASVTFAVHDLKLGKECEFEGVVFDSTANALILACKHVHIKSLKDYVVLYRWNLADAKASDLSQIKVPLEAVVGENGWKEFNPSDITVDPLTGNYVILASLQRGLLTLTPAGVVVSSRTLPDHHPMAEGLAITRDSILIISDEATRQPAAITLYRWP